MVLNPSSCDVAGQRRFRGIPHGAYDRGGEGHWPHSREGEGHCSRGDLTLCRDCPCLMRVLVIEILRVCWHHCSKIVLEHELMHMVMTGEAVYGCGFRWPKHCPRGTQPRGCGICCCVDRCGIGKIWPRSVRLARQTENAAIFRPFRGRRVISMHMSLTLRQHDTRIHVSSSLWLQVWQRRDHQMHEPWWPTQNWGHEERTCFVDFECYRKNESWIENNKIDRAVMLYM